LQVLSHNAVSEIPQKALSRHRRWIALAIHSALITLAFLISFALRFDFELPPDATRVFWATLPVLLVVRLAIFARVGLFRMFWRHASLRDLVDLQAAVTLGSLVFAFALFVIGRLEGMPRSVLILDWVLTIFLCGGVRFAARYTSEVRPRFQALTGRRTLLIGSGPGAEALLRRAQQEPDSDLLIVGLVDDDPSTHDLLLNGVPVLGAMNDLQRLVSRFHIELLVITVHEATKEQMHELVDRCAATGIQYKILPSLTEMLTGPTPGGRLRDVRIEDLLGRQPISLDLASVAHEVTGRSILITGAAGSIGSELARQLAAFRPARLILFERAETPLYFVNLEIARAHPEIEVIPAMGDVTDPKQLDHVFARFRPDYVFHAAAYKHVPMLETNVREAVRNNVVGTRHVVASARRHNVRKFVLISTDKAVNPSSVMGATKRVAERILLGSSTAGQGSTEFRVVRFGNVLGSDGSVIPLFQRQISAGQPLTVTHPDVRRYFMTIPEAVQLVLQAAVLPEAAGRICMLEMGEPVRILYLAEQMIRLSGLTPYKDVPIVFTGLRPGEKLDEELMSNIEATVPTVVEKIRLVATDELDGDALVYGLDRISTLLAEGTELEVREALRSLVPEYCAYIPRAPFADVEVALDGAARGVSDRRPAVRAPQSPSRSAPESPVEPMGGSINVARAS
jgi:FlaA1/EpsC-like NDP-sugar epimerase